MRNTEVYSRLAHSPTKNLPAKEVKSEQQSPFKEQKQNPVSGVAIPNTGFVED
jgi:hypothetical protein